VRGVLVTSWAMLLDLKTIWVITAILAGDVVTVFAFFACQSDFWTNVVACHSRAFRFMTSQCAKSFLTFCTEGRT